MAGLGDLFLSVGVDISGFSAAMGDVNDGLKNATREVKSSTSGWKEAFSSMQTVGLGMTAAITAPMVGFGLAAIKVSEDLNMARLSFTTMLGSAEAAGAFLEKLKSFAASTPFEFPDLVTASKRMMAMGFEAGQVVPTLRIIGDSVAALGGGSQMIDRVTLALGQMQAKGKVSAQEMNQLAENGIPAWQMLADEIGVGIPEAMKMAEKGAISASVALPAILAGMDAKFAGQMQKASQTLTGIWSNFKDEATFALGEIGTTLAPILKSLVTDVAMPLLSWAREMAAGFASMDPTLQKVILGFAALLAAAGPLLLAVGTLGQAWIGVSTVLGVIGPILSGVGAAIAAISAPVVAVTAVVVALGVAAYEMYQHWDSIKPVLVGLWTDISNAATAVFGPVVAFLEPLFTGTTTLWKALWSNVRDFLGGVWTSIAAAASSVWDSIVNKFNVALELLGKILPATAAALKAPTKGMYDLSDAEKEAQKYAEDLEGKIGKLPPVLKKAEDSTKAVEKANKALAAAFGELGLKTKDGKTKLESMGNALKVVEKAWQTGQVPLSAYIEATENFNEQVKKAKLDELKKDLDKLTIAYKEGGKTTAEYVARKKELTAAIEKLDPAIQKTERVVFDMYEGLAKLDEAVLSNTHSLQDMSASLNIGAAALAATLKPANDSIAAVLRTEEAYKSLGITSTATLTKQVAEATQNYEAIKNSGTASARDIAIAHDAMTQAIKKANESGTATTLDELGKRKKGVTEFATQVSTIFTDFSKDVVKSLFSGDLSIGEKFTSMLKSMGEAVLRVFIEPATAALTTFMNGVIKDLIGGKGFGGVLDGIKGMGEALGGIFGGGAGTVSDIAGGVSSGLPGGALGTGGSAAGSAAGSAVSGLTGIFSAIGSIGSLVSGIIGNFQFMGMNKSLDIIVMHTLQTANDLANLRADAWAREGHLFAKLDDWRNYLELQMDSLIQSVRSGGDWLYEVTTALQAQQLSLNSMTLAGGGVGGGVTIDLRGSTFLNDRQMDEVLDQLTNRLKQRNA